MMRRHTILRLLLTVWAAILLVVAFYAGGAIGFNEGFLAGTRYAHTTTAGLVLNIVKAPPEAPLTEYQRSVLEDMLDQALVGYNDAQRGGGSSFDIIGVRQTKDSAKRIVLKIAQYRQQHPSQSSVPEFKALIEQLVARMDLPPVPPDSRQPKDPGVDAARNDEEPGQ